MTRPYAILYDPNEISPAEGSNVLPERMLRGVRYLMDDPESQTYYVGFGWIVRMDNIAGVEYFCAIADSDDIRKAANDEPNWDRLMEKAEIMLHCTPSGHIVALYG